MRLRPIFIEKVAVTDLLGLKGYFLNTKITAYRLSNITDEEARRRLTRAFDLILSFEPIGTGTMSSKMDGAPSEAGGNESVSTKKMRPNLKSI